MTQPPPDNLNTYPDPRQTGHQSNTGATDPDGPVEPTSGPEDEQESPSTTVAKRSTGKVTAPRRSLRDSRPPAHLSTLPQSPAGTRKASSSAREQRNPLKQTKSGTPRRLTKKGLEHQLQQKSQSKQQGRQDPSNGSINDEDANMSGEDDEDNHVEEENEDESMIYSEGEENEQSNPANDAEMGNNAAQNQSGGIAPKPAEKKLPGVHPFSPRHLPAAGQNVEDEYRLPREERPDGIRVLTIMQPLIEEHITWEQRPTTKTDYQVEKLSIDSHKYELTPPLNDEDAVNQLIKDHMLNQGWHWRSLPAIRVVPAGQQSTTIYLQFINSAGSIRMEQELRSFAIESGTGNDKIIYRFGLKTSGRKVDMEILSVSARLIDSSYVNTSAPISHNDMRRIARTFAQHARASPSNQYPTARDGILALWRKVKVDCHKDGTVSRSDFNCFEMVLRVSAYDQEHVRMKPYHTDGNTGFNFVFTFPGSEKFCNVHADNTLHPDGYCKKKTCNTCKRTGGRGGHWDWEHVHALHSRPGRTGGAQENGTAIAQNDVSSGSRGRGPRFNQGRANRGRASH